MEAPLILLLDTTASVSSFAIFQNGLLLACKHHFEAQEQAAIINVYIEELLKEAGKKIQDINAIGICSGPGSYTGMRIGYSVAKGICYGLNIPLLPINKFEVLAYDATHFPLMIALKARADEYFLGIKNDSNSWIIKAQHSELSGLQELIKEHAVTNLWINDADVNLDGLVSNNYTLLANNEPLNMIHLGNIAVENLANGLEEAIAYAEPLYLKAVYTTTSKKKSLLGLS